MAWTVVINVKIRRPNTHIRLHAPPDDMVTRFTLGREPREMGYRKLTARPRHHGQKLDDIAAFKKVSQFVRQKSGRPSPEARR